MRNEDDVSMWKICKVIHAGRDKEQNEIYIANGWYEFKKQCNLKKGNTISFQVINPPQFINVKVHQTSN